MRFFLILAFFLAIPAISVALTWPPSPTGTQFNPATTTLPEMIKYLYEWGVVLGGLAAFVMLVVAGFQYLTSAGDPGKISDARGRITSAIGGLVLLLASFLILNFINPELTNLRLPSLTLPGDSEVTDQLLSGLPPAGSCAMVKIYSEKDYQGKETTIELPRTETTRTPQTNEPLSFGIKTRGSLKFWAYVSDTPQLPDGSTNPDFLAVKEGGTCLVSLFELPSCAGNPEASLSGPTPNIATLSLKRMITCAGVEAL